MRLSIILLILLLVAVTAQAATLTVSQDGRGDYDTIGEAIRAASRGDQILIGPGVYSEVLELSKSLDLIAASGAQTVTLDGQGSFRILLIEGDCQVRLEGLDFQNAYSDNGAALMVWQGVQLDVVDCRFLDNFAWESNAVHVRGDETSATFEGCEFRNNTCNVHSAAMGVGYGARVLIDECQFIDNRAGVMSGAVNAYQAQLGIKNSLFQGNSAQGTGAVVILASDGAVEGNTFYGNSGVDHGSVYIHGSVPFRNNIIANEKSGYGLTCGAETPRSCNIYFRNKSGSLAEGELVPSEMRANPMFCDPKAEDFTVHANSPALGSDCGLVGAFPEGCPPNYDDLVAVESQSWGGLKATYR